jgi:glycosyltransferase involved in cell wall biosynthesis
MHRDLSSMSVLKKFIYIHFILKNRDEIICNSHNTKNSIKAFTKKKISVVYNGTDESLFYPRQNTLRSAKALKIITTCRLIHSKRVDVLIKAFNEYRIKVNQNSFLTIVGDGPERKKLEFLGNKLSCNNIEFLGNIENEKVGKYLRESDIFVTCSETEGFGNSTIEAYFCGLYVIVSDIAIHQELGGLEFNFFETNNIGSLVETIKAVAKKKRRNTTKNKLAYLSTSETTSKLIDLYND